MCILSSEQVWMCQVTQDGSNIWMVFLTPGRLTFAPLFFPTPREGYLLDKLPHLVAAANVLWLSISQAITSFSPHLILLTGQLHSV